MGNPFAIQVFYPDGDPENMRIVDKRNWTGKVFYISRDYWSTVAEKYRQKLETSGVYILAGANENLDDDDNDDLQSIYIGQSGNLLIRVEQHIQDNERSFGEMVCITGGEGFNNTHFRWMEAYLVEKARENNRCKLNNIVTPIKPQISEADEVDIKNFLKETLQIFPVVEVYAFAKPKIVKSPPTLGLNAGKETHRVWHRREKSNVK